ncbi:hypothetical protein Tco_1390517 [Tanacetum coccineum]
MSTHEQITNNPTSALRNTGGRNGPQGLEEPMSDEVLREVCDKNYHQLLSLIAEKMQKEKEQKDKLNVVKARLIYGEESGIKVRSREESHYSESKTPTARTEPKRRHGDRYSRSPSPHASVFKRLKKYKSPSPRPRPRKEGGVFNRLGRKEPATSARSDSRQRSPQAKRTEVEARRRQQRQTPSRATSQYSESEDVKVGSLANLSKKAGKSIHCCEDDLYQPWTCKERNPFTPRIRHFSLLRTRMPSHVKTYDGSGDREDHLKLFQSAAKTEGVGQMPTWVTYLRINFLENYLQQTKHIKDPVEIHHIKQRDGESTEDFMERYKAEVLDVEGEVADSVPVEGKASSTGNVEGWANRLSRKASKINKDRNVAMPKIPRASLRRWQCLFPTLSEETGRRPVIIEQSNMVRALVHRAYIDGGASSDVLYAHCF